MNNIIPWRGPEPENSRPFQRLANRGPIFMPESVFEHSTRTNLDREAVTYVCESCGVVEPIAIDIGGTARIGYLRRECDCQRRERDRLEVINALAAARTEFAQKSASRTYTWLSIDQPELALMTFENFNPDGQPERYRAATLSAYDYARGYASMCLANVSGQPNILFQGKYGTGKTHLACAVLNQLREHGIRCLFTTAQDLFDSLYAAPFDEKPIILRQASDTPLLVLDDLDKLHVAQSTDGAFQKRTLFDILDRRYKGHRPTIITTNEQTDLSPWLDGATISRLLHNLQSIPMNGADYRLLKRTQRTR